MKLPKNSTNKSHETGSVAEVFAAFLKLGLTSFGGPIAHFGYFKHEFVDRRKWLDDHRFSQLLALCQFLPGPASSQLGFSIGLLRAGWRGALAAFLAFTLPSAILLFAFAAVVPEMAGPTGQAALHGLKLVALAVVASGVLGMLRQLCPDWQRIVIAGIGAALALLAQTAWMQGLVIGLGAVAGLILCRNVRPVEETRFRLAYGFSVGVALLSVFVFLLGALPLLAHDSLPLVSVAEAFYRAGALVFGGGHVVLPLLQESLVHPGWIAPDEFMAGYGAAQAVPGPMFSLAAYLGGRLPDGMGGPAGSVVALCAIFLPGFLLIAGILPLWSLLATRPPAARAIAGVNAAVVGLLAAALYDPVWTSAVQSYADVAIAAVGFIALFVWRVSALWIVAWSVLGAMAVSLLAR